MGKNESLLDGSGLIGWLGRNVFVKWTHTSVLKTWLSQLSVFPRAERHPSTDTSLTWWQSRQKSSFFRTLLRESQKLCDSFPYSCTLPRTCSLQMCSSVQLDRAFSKLYPLWDHGSHMITTVQWVLLQKTFFPKCRKRLYFQTCVCARIRSDTFWQKSVHEWAYVKVSFFPLWKQSWPVADD